MRSKVNWLVFSGLLKQTVSVDKEEKQRPFSSLDDCGLNLATTLQHSAHNTLFRCQLTVGLPVRARESGLKSYRVLLFLLSVILFPRLPSTRTMPADRSDCYGGA